MALHPKPRRVLILGGGEGATAREILRYAFLHQVTMVDIDSDVVMFCKKYLRSWHRGSFVHAKTRLVVGDAKHFIETSHEKFDVILSDLPTPASAKEPVAALYTASFYTRLRERLSPGGILGVQSGSGHAFHMKFHVQLSRILHTLFRTVSPYFTFIPSFDEPWSFLLASSGRDPASLVSGQINKKLGNLSGRLRFYDGQTHESMFNVPKHIREK